LIAKIVGGDIMWSGTDLHEFISEHMASRPRRRIHSRN